MYAQTFFVIKPLIIHFLAILHSLIQENTETTVGVKIVTGLADAYSKEATSKGRIQILSAVAPHMSAKELQDAFKHSNKNGEITSCTPYEITKAKIHQKLYGATAKQPKKPIIRMCTPIEDIAFVLEFLHSPEAVQRSSYKTASCEGKKGSWISELLGGGTQPVMWLKKNKARLYQHYREECTKKERKPIGKTKFYEGLDAGNFHEMAEMAGLCNHCTEYGGQNFQSLETLLDTIEKRSPLTCSTTTYKSTIPEMRKRVKRFKGYLIAEFPKHLRQHDECATHCMHWYLSSSPDCTHHPNTCHLCNERWSIFEDLQKCIDETEGTHEEKAELVDSLQQIQSNLSQYISHLVRSVHQRQQFQQDIQNLQPGETVIVVDYMMKLLFRKLYEPQSDWFGKKGVSLHGAMFFYRETSDGPIMTEYHDYFTEDDRQNWFFSASCIEESCRNFKELHPQTNSMKIWSDNGPHYKNTSLIFWLSNLKSLTNIELLQYNNFEPQEGKTKLDSHYATLKFALKSYMKEKHDVTSTDSITRGASGRLRGTHIYEVSINRTEEPASATTWSGISKYFSFTYKYNDDSCFDSIVAQEQTGLGRTNKICHNQMKGLWKNETSTTGASSKFEMEAAAKVTKLPPKQKHSRQEPHSTNNDITATQNQKECNNILTPLLQCPDCHTVFLREGNIQRHRQSAICIQKQQQSNHLKRKIDENTTLGTSIKQAKQLQDIEFDKSQAQLEKELESQNKWNILIRGSALKSQQPKRSAIRFNKYQIEVMVDCYNKGQDKSKRYTPHQCQVEMGKHLNLTPKDVLSESQIRSYWSRYHRNKNKP